MYYVCNVFVCVTRGAYMRARRKCLITYVRRRERDSPYIIGPRGFSRRARETAGAHAVASQCRAATRETRDRSCAFCVCVVLPHTRHPYTSYIGDSCSVLPRRNGFGDTRGFLRKHFTCTKKKINKIKNHKTTTKFRIVAGPRITDVFFTFSRRFQHRYIIVCYIRAIDGEIIRCFRRGTRVTIIIIHHGGDITESYVCPRIVSCRGFSVWDLARRSRCTRSKRVVFEQTRARKSRRPESRVKRTHVLDHCT